MLSKLSIAALVAALAISGFVPAVSAKTAAPDDDTLKAVAVCDATLAALGHVTPAQVLAFGGNNWVLPLCQRTAPLRDAELNGSQAAGLIDAIAANPVLMRSLKARGFGLDNIVGLSISVDGARIFVHGT